jgi:hypothetical protein
MDNGAEITRMINTASESAANTVNRTLTELQDTAGKAIEKSQATAKATVGEMMETHNMLRADTTALFERLREANIMLQEVLSGSHENMSALENTLMLRVSEFVTAMNEVPGTTGVATERVEPTIANFLEITAHVVTDLGQLASQFDQHGRELALAASQIDDSNKRTDDTVNERRAQLDSLIATLDIRTEDIEQRLKRFSGLLDESLEAASVRAREVARVVSEASAEGSRAVTEQFERVRETAEEERQRTIESMKAVYQQTSADASSLFHDASQRFVDATQGLRDVYQQTSEDSDALFRNTSERFSDATRGLRSLYEQSAGDTQSMFRETAQRFAETVQDMKQMAAEMQREMEATRTELRRGVFDLPQETAEGAAQMRRVIVDQIEALAELNRIVARHGRNLDAVEPITRRPQRDEQPLAAIGSRHETSSRPEMAPPPPLPRQAPVPMPPPPRPEVANFAPAARRAEAPALSPATAPLANNAGRGWLSDLLTRASRDENEPQRDGARDLQRDAQRDLPRESQRDSLRDLPRDTQRDLPREAPALPMRETARGPEERSPRHSIESLDSLSVDIARMIDHDAAADLWDRYKRGERNVFTRRLYTLQGQQAFDEIRKKYRADREFKQTVDRYIGEFERLLEEVSRDDRGQVVARTYLTSETGKVYTMLAHAAGRFD